MLIPERRKEIEVDQADTKEILLNWCQFMLQKWQPMRPDFIRCIGMCRMAINQSTELLEEIDRLTADNAALTKELDEAKGWLDHHVTAQIVHIRPDNSLSIINTCNSAASAYAELEAELKALRIREDNHAARLSGETG